MKNGETRFAQIKVNMTSNLVNPSNPIINSLDSSYPLQLFFLDDGVRLGERSTAERLMVERAVVRLRQPVRGAERPPATALEPRAQPHLLVAPPAPLHHLRRRLARGERRVRHRRRRARRNFPDLGLDLHVGNRRRQRLGQLLEAEVSVALGAEAARGGVSEEAAAIGAEPRAMAELPRFHSD